MRSYLPEYELVPASNLQEALVLLSSGEGWGPIAGGTDLMVLFNAGKLPRRKLVSVRGLPELRSIDLVGDSVVIGAAVTYTQIRNDRLLQEEFPMLCAAASWTGGIANQNRGTLGGNIVNASPAADSAPALLAYDAVLHLTSERGKRRIPYHSFHLSYRRTELAPHELLTAIELPRRQRDESEYVRKVGPRGAQAIAKVCVAARAFCSEGVIQDARIAFGSVAPIPLRCVHTEALLLGRAVNANLIEEARTTLRAEIKPISDIRSTDKYRAQVSANLLGDFLRSLK